MTSMFRTFCGMLTDWNCFFPAEEVLYKKIWDYLAIERSK